MTRLAASLAAVLAALTLAACAGGGTTEPTFTGISGPWTASQQEEFIGGCTADGTSSQTWCVCALRYAMAADPVASAIKGVGLESGPTSIGSFLSGRHDLAPGCGS